jgi:hypothetical protein
MSNEDREILRRGDIVEVVSREATHEFHPSVQEIMGYKGHEFIESELCEVVATTVAEVRRFAEEEYDETDEPCGEMEVVVVLKALKRDIEDMVHQDDVVFVERPKKTLTTILEGYGACSEGINRFKNKKSKSAWANISLEDFKWLVRQEVISFEEVLKAFKEVHEEPPVQLRDY